MGVVPVDGVRDPRPRRSAPRVLELPPVGVDADAVEPFDDRGDGAIVDGPVLAGNNLEQQVEVGGAAGAEQLHHSLFLFGAQGLRVVGMIQEEAFHRVIDGPFVERASHVRSALETKRSRAGLFDGAANPQTGVGGLIQDFPRILAIGDDAGARPIPDGCLCCPEGQLLESGDAVAGNAVALGEVFEMAPMVEREGTNLGPFPAPVRRPMNLREPRILAQGSFLTPVFQEKF